MGKTTLCINLAYSLARRGWRVLLIDTDPQGGVGLSLAKSTKAREGVHEFLVRGGDLSKMVVSTRLPELEIIPAGQYDTCARQGWSVHEVPARLADLMRGAELRGVDVVLMDTAAGAAGHPQRAALAGDAGALPCGGRRGARGGDFADDGDAGKRDEPQGGAGTARHAACQPDVSAEHSAPALVSRSERSGCAGGTDQAQSAAGSPDF